MCYLFKYYIKYDNFLECVFLSCYYITEKLCPACVGIIILNPKGGNYLQRSTYNDKVNIENEKRLRRLCRDLPGFCREFFRGIEPTTSSRTRIAYGYDLRVFFRFLEEEYPELEEGPVKTWPVTVLDKMMSMDSYKVISDDTIRVFQNSSESEKIAKAFMEAGITLKELSFKEQTLEEYFMNVTGGDTL